MYDKPGWAVISGNYTGRNKFGLMEKVFIVQLTKDQKILCVEICPEPHSEIRK